MRRSVQKSIKCTAGMVLRKTRLLLFIPFGIFLLSAGVAFAKGGDVVWQHADPQAGKQDPSASVMDNDGNIIITGYQNVSGGMDDDYWTVKLRGDNGGVAWRASFNKVGGTDRAAAVAAAVDSNNDIVVTGFVWNGNNQDIHTIKYSGATGDILWQHTYNGVANGSDTGTAVAVYGSYIYVGGYSQNTGGNDDFVVLKYHLNGTSPLAEVIYNGSANGADRLAAIAVDGTGFAVTGKSWNGSADEMLTIKYDLNGNKLWEARRAGAGGASGKQVKMGPGGTVIASGTAANGIDVDLYTAKYSAGTGAVAWDRTYNGAYDDEPFGLAIDGAGDVYVTGYTWTLEGNNDFYTARYNGSSGAIVWEQRFDSGNGNTDMSIATGIVVDEGGDVFVTGFTVTDGNYDFQTIKYQRTTGNQLWQRSFNGADNRNERPVGIALTEAGEIVVSGWSESIATGMDYIVIKYDKGAINPPTSLSVATLADTSIRLNWIDNSSNESGFRIQRKTGLSGTWADIATVGANVVTYTDPAAGLAPGTYYYYRVLSFNGQYGDSHYSNEAWGLTVYVNYISPSWSFLRNEANREDFAVGIAVGSDDHPVVTGTVLTGEDEFNLNYNYLTMKLDRGDNHTIWSDLYDDEDGEYDAAKCIAVDRNDNVIVSGISSLYFAPASRNINSMFTLKYPSSGPPTEWGAQYNGTGAIDDRATAIATTADGADNIVIIGYGKNASIPANDDIYVVKYNAAGTRAWAAAQYDGGKGDQPRSVAVAPDGSVFVTGYSEKAPGGVYNFFTAKYDGATGTRIWTDIYSVTSGGDNQGKSAAVDGKGDLYVTGYATGATGSRDIHTIKYSGSGNTPVKVWERSFDGLARGDDTGVAVRVDPIDGAIVVAGTTRSGAGDNDFTVIRYSPDGTTLWERTLQKPQTDDLLVDMAIDASGYLYLAGSAGNGSADVLSLLYDHLGNFIGATSFDGATHDNDEADAVAVNYRGEAFIAGYSTNAAGNTDYLVVKQTNTRLLVPAPFAAASLPAHDKLVLNWRDNTPGATFTIERSTDSVNWAAVAALPAGTISYQDAGLAANTRYCYRITASKNGVSRPIGACATTTLPPPILNPAAVVSATAVSLGWNNVAGNTGYKVERSTDGSSWSQIGDILAADSTAYNDTGLTAGAVYYYRVSTVSPAGTSIPSAVQVAPALNAVTVVSGTRIDLAWPGISGNTGYRIDRSTDNANWVQLATPLQGATTYSDTTVTPGILYFYRLKVATSSGVSGASISQQGATSLTAPTLQSASGITTSQLTLTWNAVTGDTAGYAIWEQGCNYNNSSSDIDYCTISYGWAWGSWNQVGTTGPGVTTFTRTGLAAGNSYQYYVAAKSTAGVTSPASNVKLAWTIPAAPVLNPPSAPSDSAVTLTWNNVPGDNGYTIQRKVGAAGTYVDVNTLAKNITTWTDTAVIASTTYFYRVRAAGITASSAYSNEREITTPPVGPVVASVTATSSTIVTWNNVLGNIGYEIRRSYFNYCSRPDRAGNSSYASYWTEWSQLAGTIAQNQTTFTDSNVLPGYNYKYSIRAILPEGSATGWGSDGGKFALTIPPVPGGLYLSGMTSTQINANWSDVCGELNFGIQYKQRSGADCATETWSTGVGSVSGIGMNVATSSIAGVNSSVPYCFQVRAYNGSGTSAWSAAATYLPPPELAVPTNIAQTTLSLSWTNVSGNTGYRVERSTDNVSFNLISTRGANTTTYNDSGLSSGITYYYRIKTLIGSTSSAPSNVRTVTTLAPTPPVLNPPTNITSSQMTLSWEDISGNYGYKVEQSPNGTTWTQLATPAQGVVTYTATGLASGTLYYYRVSTKTASGSYTAPSNVQSATTLLPPPVVYLTMINEGSISLRWQLIYNATQYKVARSIGMEGPWTQLSALARSYTTSYCGYSYPTVGCPNLTADSTSYLDAGLTEDTQYCYQVTAWAINTGDSEPSAVVCMKTPAVGRPNLTATAENSMKIRLDWTYDPSSCTPTPCGSPDGFEVWKQAWNGEWALKAKVYNGTTYTDTSNVEPMKSYTYRIRAFRGSDVSSFSNQAGAKAPAYVTTDQPCVVP